MLFVSRVFIQDHRAGSGPDPEVEWRGGCPTARSFLLSFQNDQQGSAGVETRLGINEQSGRTELAKDAAAAAGGDRPSPRALLASCGHHLVGRYIALFRPSVRLSLVSKCLAFDPVQVGDATALPNSPPAHNPKWRAGAAC